MTHLFKNMKKLILPLLVLLVSGATFAQTTTLKTKVDSLNYAAGMVAAENAKRVLGSDINVKLFLEAFNAGVKGEKTAFTAENAPKVEQSISAGMWKDKNAQFLEQNKKR